MNSDEELSFTLLMRLIKAWTDCSVKEAISLTSVIMDFLEGKLGDEYITKLESWRLQANLKSTNYTNKGFKEST